MGCGGSKVDTTAQDPNKQNQGNQQNQRGQRGRQTGTGQGNRKNHQQQPVNEKGYKKRIREDLRRATDGEDIEWLEKKMDVFERNKLADAGDLTAAREKHDFLQTRKNLRDAIMRNHPKVLEDAIYTTEQSPYARQLKPQLDRARYQLQHQEDQKMFKHCISDLDQTAVSEVKSYKTPPTGCHDTMTAVYMLCGYEEKHLTKDWSTICALMNRFGNRSLLKEMHDAEGRPVDKDVALRCNQYLGAHSLPQIRAESNSVATFYQWANTMIGQQQGNNKKQTPNTTATGSRRGQQQGQRGDTNKPKTPSEPSKAKTDSVKDKKKQKELENKAKQQANHVADKTVNDNRQAVSNTQTARNARQTAQQVNAVANKPTRKG